MPEPVAPVVPVAPVAPVLVPVPVAPVVPAAPVVPVAPLPADLDTPLRDLFDAVVRAQASAVPDLPAVARALVRLAADHDYLAHRLTTLGDRSGAIPLHCPERGPRLQLVHRRASEMGAIHDHGCWVVLATVTGIETHRRFRLRQAGAALTELELASEVAVRAGQAVSVLAPRDIHAHGHPPGQGEAYVLIMTGDDQRRNRRSEWDAATGRHRWLEPGDGGRWLESEAFPG